MSEYGWFVFFLCLVVFVTLTSLFCLLIGSVVGLTVKLIRSGAEDEKIREERAKPVQKSRKTKVLERTLSLVLSGITLILLAFVLFVNLAGNTYFEKVPTLQAVQSGSMSSKRPGNAYLYENELNDQIAMFDLILTYRVPDEFDLKLYNIVVYEMDGVQIVHRIIGIEEPGEKHPDHRLFTLQGDAMGGPDKFAVQYSQMKGIYRGDRIPFAGSAVLFLQSPAGWLCVLLMLFALVASPFVERKIMQERQKRLMLVEAEGAEDTNQERNQNSGDI